ncbi:rhomboid family intramembrane serine protease [Nonomuraea sp. SMC257]|uniref:Rhomboid family intramembrane serine protease n=1 Tax=Nonomuraea montanisoli TaxID=2741721 RepID=A0A7Y6M0Y5_9ACTN|nr:rhomboid family intramembrane serine protease [Nonomuraea montanisoli]NUW29851.1 rhomboid family intramembrane serine protease [Nonomuraea montanisoli]
MNPPSSPGVPAARPLLTWAVFGVTAATTAAGLLVPGFAPVLVRTDDFFHGEGWRLITPILVNPEGWHQVVFNGVMLLLVGVIAERTFGRARWAALYLAGGLAGNAFSYVMSDYGAGSSVAVAGLAGGLAAWVLSGRAGLPVPPRIAAGALLAGGAALAALGDNHGAPLLVGALLGTVFLRTMRDVPSMSDVRPTRRARTP